MPNIVIRQLKKEDLYTGFLDSLDSLRKTSGMDEKKAFEIFERINQNPNHVVFVAVLDNKIIGATTVLIEPKFIHDGGLVSHIEDVVVSRDFQGSGVGKKLIEAALEFAKKSGCYKTILDCSEDVRPFYEKIGFFHHSNAMRFNHD